MIRHNTLFFLVFVVFPCVDVASSRNFSKLRKRKTAEEIKLATATSVTPVDGAEHETLEIMAEKEEQNDFWSRFLATSSSLEPVPAPTTTSPPVPEPTTPSPQVPEPTPAPVAITTIPPAQAPSLSFPPASEPTPAPVTITTIPPAQAPAFANIVTVDFRGASIDNILTFTSESATTVNVLVDDPVDKSVFLVTGKMRRFVGTTCPPAGGIWLPALSSTVSVNIDGMDSTIVLCQGNSVIGFCLHEFP